MRLTCQQKVLAWFFAGLILAPAFALVPRLLTVIGLALVGVAVLVLAAIGFLLVAVCYGIWLNPRAEAGATFADTHKKLSAGGKTSAPEAESWPEEIEAEDSRKV